MEIVWLNYLVRYEGNPHPMEVRRFLFRMMCVSDGRFVNYTLELSPGPDEGSQVWMGRGRDGHGRGDPATSAAGVYSSFGENASAGDAQGSPGKLAGFPPENLRGNFRGKISRIRLESAINIRFTPWLRRSADPRECGFSVFCGSLNTMPGTGGGAIVNQAGLAEQPSRFLSGSLFLTFGLVS